MKKMEGFTFIELIMSLFLMSIIVAAILPVIVSIQNERLSIRDERFVEEYIHQLYYEVNLEGILHEPHTITKNGVNYQVSIKPRSRIQGVCISWEGRNRREYERCLSN